MRKKYRIISFADLYGSQWLVIRLADLRIVKSFPPGAIYDALAWVKSWGDDEWTMSKKGAELSHRAIARMYR